MGLYRRDDSPYWWTSFTVHGRVVRRSTGATVKGTAKAIAAGIQTEAAAAIPQRDKWRVHVMTGTYLANHAADLRSAATVTYQLDNINRLLGKDRFIADLSDPDVIEYRARRKADGVSNSSVNRELQTLRAALTFAKDRYKQQVPAIEWKGLFLKEPPGRTRFLSPAEFRALSDACDDELRTIVLIAVATGLRKDNIETLTWERINLDQSRAHVIVKGNKAHTVKLNPSVIAALARTAPDARHGPVFTQPNRRKRFAAAVAVAGLIDFRFHDLRHTFASWARLAGADITDVMEALAHSDVSMTMRYAHITPETHRTAFDAVADLFAPAVVKDLREA